ncbi:MAG TPA: GGDEF domain-containing protein [Thermoanaerobaculia bacterium]|nr:GGDEF domain-containing protein [Thermoanaerobaculia bacterium]
MIEDEYRGPRWWPLSALQGKAVAGIGPAWAGLTALCIGLAILEARLDWSGMPVRIGPVTVGVSVYPPLSISLVLAVWIGPLWGLVPAWLATFSSALTAGVPLPSAAVFALATPAEVFLLWGSMVALNIDPALPRFSDLRRFLAAGLVAASGSSPAILIWNESRHLDLVAGQRLWQGWLLGDLLQIALVAAPLLHFLGPRANAFLEKRFDARPKVEFRYRDGVLWTGLVSVTLAAVVALGLRMALVSLRIPETAVTARGEPLLPRLREMTLFAGLLLGVVLVTSSTFGASLARLGDREKSSARRDPLTGCLNRRAFYEAFALEADRSARLAAALSVLTIDVDRFKVLNDAHGHAFGDEILRQLARRLTALVRSHDLVVRWGGEEFVVLLPHTSPGDAAALAERIRAGVESPEFRVDGRAVSLTCSVGVAGTQVFPASADDLVAQSDAACYEAKRAGRNRTVSVEIAALKAPSAS